MLFNKSLFASVLVVALSSQAYAHAVISPAIQVTGTPVRKNAVKPSTNAPCGKNVDIAASASTAQTVAANGDSFSVTVQNFNK
ncbi:hypothetical protein EWM64_g10818 [Hericium alpestre]|uniref:Uncharacterized protein n=1 Tax=Hericium alpestre TaxID=135208 RepID=A0A4Y9ZFG1_9AGAM|nr:hypothetical protein EWM64_g10818 [Hericium alpestre]